MLADLSVKGGRFTYESRWIRLNSNALQPIRAGDLTSAYPDRGANYKVFAVELGHWRFGLQDTAVYYGREFDAEYFLSPIPSILTQMVTKRDSTPWQEDANDNSILGLFAEWRPPWGYLYAQWLVDDISLNFLIPWFLRDTFGNPTVANKWAWSVGGHWDLPFGRLGFYHAGATKYTFAATEDDKPYGYTYYPAVEYSLDDTMTDFEAVLDPQDNYLGYKYGENNLAFRLELSHLPHPVLGADFQAALEYVLSGSKSPANPWHGEPRPRRDPHVRRPGAGAHGDRGGQRGLALAGLDLLLAAAPGRGVQPPGAGAGGQMRRCPRSTAPRPGRMPSCTPGPWASPGARAGAGPRPARSCKPRPNMVLQKNLACGRARRRLVHERFHTRSPGKKGPRQVHPLPLQPVPGQPLLDPAAAVRRAQHPGSRQEPSLRALPRTAAAGRGGRAPGGADRGDHQ